MRPFWYQADYKCSAGAISLIRAEILKPDELIMRQWGKEATLTVLLFMLRSFRYFDCKRKKEIIPLNFK